MAAKNTGKSSVENEPKVGASVGEPRNEFAPSLVNGRSVEPNALPRVAPPAPVVEVAPSELEFIDYVKNDLSDVAKSFGYEVVLKRLVNPDAEFSGPTARYSLESGEMRVFHSKSDVPVGFVSYDEYLATQLAE